jgi:CubicO group peptidase (beta-lactamase class C family)
MVSDERCHGRDAGISARADERQMSLNGSVLPSLAKKLNPILLSAVLILISFTQFAFSFPRTGSDAAIAHQAWALLNRTASPSGPGIAMLIAHGDRVVIRAARGQANIELNVSLRSDQVFRIASITKMFVAALLVKLGEEGKLSLDDRLMKFLPEFPGAAGISLRQLLNHTAGISDRIPPEARMPGFSRRDLKTAELVAEIAKRPADFVPGTNQSYSNAGYILLGAVIEKTTGLSWHEALASELLRPLGLAHTRYGNEDAILPGRVGGYSTDGPDHRIRNAPFISISAPGAAGGLVSTVEDLRRWMRSLIDGKAISAAGLKQITTPAEISGRTLTESYGLGMYSWRVRDETMIGHTGQINGFASVLAYLPSRDVTIIALGNDDNFDAQTFGRRLASIGLGNPYPVVTAIPVSAADLAAIPGQYQDGQRVRTIGARAGQLYSQWPGRDPAPLQMSTEGRLYFMPDELSYLVPVRDSAGAVIRLDYFPHGDGPPLALPRLRTDAK